MTEKIKITKGYYEQVLLPGDYLQIKGEDKDIIVKIISVKQLDDPMELEIEVDMKETEIFIRKIFKVY